MYLYIPIYTKYRFQKAFSTEQYLLCEASPNLEKKLETRDFRSIFITYNVKLSSGVITIPRIQKNGKINRRTLLLK